MPNLTQSRGHQTSAARAALRNGGDAARQAFVQKNLEMFAGRLVFAAERGEGWAIRTGLEICGWVGTDRVLAAFLEALGVRDEQEARMLVDRGRALANLEEASVETHWQEAMTLLEQCLREKPELLEATQARLAGRSTATVQDGHDGDAGTVLRSPTDEAGGLGPA